MAQNNIQKAAEFGQSIWCDYISRRMIGDGTLDGMIADGVRGVTSNPSIFQKAIAGSSDYDDLISSLAAKGASDTEIYDDLTIGDVGSAADKFLPLWRATNGLDGYVSLEVSPLLADDTATTFSEAQRLWQRLNRPNVMIKIPATPAGIPAIVQAIAAGINVNATLIFSREQYEDVANAYINGLLHRAAAGLPLKGIASVASAFISRIDTAVDKLLTQSGNTTLNGHIAVDNARMIYKSFKQIFSTSEWKKLTVQGAVLQRPLWASPSAKNPSYRATMYVDDLLYPDTVNTVPPATLKAFAKSGIVSRRMAFEAAGAEARLELLSELNINLRDITDRLLTDGVNSFVDSFKVLMASIAEKRARLTA